MDWINIKYQIHRINHVEINGDYVFPIRTRVHRMLSNVHSKLYWRLIQKRNEK